MEELLEAAKEILHLHMCEQEGLNSGQPTPAMWLQAVEKLSIAIYEAELSPLPSSKGLTEEVYDILKCIAKFDKSETLEVKGDYFETIQRDVEKALPAILALQGEKEIEVDGKAIPVKTDNRYYDAMKYLADYNEITVSDIDAAIINYIQGKLQGEPTKEESYPREFVEWILTGNDGTFIQCSKGSEIQFITDIEEPFATLFDLFNHWQTIKDK